MDSKRYYLLRIAYWLLGHLPWWVIEGLSYVLAALLYSVVRYRRKVVASNLRASFPDKSAWELRALEWDFYEHLVHQFLSSPKILYQSRERLLSEHLTLEGVEQLGEDTAHGARAAIIMLGHLGNWEVLTAASYAIAEEGMQLEQLYRQLNDEALDRVQRELRSRHGAITTLKGDIGRRMVELMRSPDAEPRAVAFIADQTPTRQHIGLWTSFLHQPTAWLDGAERIARKYDLPVYYIDITRLSNRRYQARFVRMSAGARSTAPGEITRLFASLLEENIQRDPAIWLWSHKRWKHSPNEDEHID